MTTTSSNNLTGLYGDAGASVTPGTAYGNANVVSLLANSTDGANTIGNISATGNVTAAYFIGDGSKLTNIDAGNIVGGYGNSNVAAYLPTYGGNIKANSVTSNTVVNIAGKNTAQLQYDPSGAFDPYAIDGGSWLYVDNSGATFESNVSGTVHTLTIDNQANLTTSGNISGNYILGNGSQLTGLPATYGNANVAAYLPTYGGNIAANNISATGTVSATGNITTAGYFVGNFAGNITGNLTVPGSNTQVIFNNNGNAGAAAGFTYDSGSNTMTVLGVVSAQGNVIGGNVSTTGNVTGAYFVGNGSTLGSITGANVTGTVADATHATVADSANAVAGGNVTGNVANAVHAYFADVANSVAGANVTGTVADATHASVADTANSVSGSNVSGAVANAVYATSSGTAVYVTGNAQANITSVGTLTSLSSTGNITGAYFIGNGSQLTGITGTYGDANVRDYLASGTDTANIITSANISGAYILGNGSQLTGLPAGYSNANVSTYLASGTNSANIITSANISGAYILGNGSQLTGVVATSVGTLPSLSVTGNIDAGNVNSTFYGNGAGLTNITGGNVTGTVANATYAVQAQSSTSTIIAVKNTSGGTLTRGTPVYATGTVGATTVIEVAASRADTASTMGAIGLLDADLTVNATGNAISVGTLTSFDTSTYAVGQQLYVAATGGLTNARPTGGNVVQSIGTVGRVNASTGSIQVNIWDINALPNLSSGKIWQGNAAGYPTEVTPYGNANVATFLAAYGSNTISSTGNITTTANISAGYVLGNGSQLTGMYGNSNVATFLANFGSNTISTTGNITSGNITNTGQISTGGNITATDHIRVGPSAQTILTNTGNITSGNIAITGYFSATGNVYGNHIQFNDGLSGTGNIQGSNIILTGLTQTATLSATGNITTNNFYIGNGRFLSGIVSSTLAGNMTGNITGLDTYSIGNLATLGVTGNANVRGNLNMLDTGYINIGNAYLTENNNRLVLGDTDLAGVLNFGTGGQISSTGLGTVSTSGNITGGNLLTGGQVSATANITGGNILTLGTVSSAGQIQSSLNGNGIYAAYDILAGRNITANATLSALGNITSSQQTIIGTANTAGGTGNIILSGKNIATDMLRNPDAGTATVADLGRVFLGTGYLGNTNPAYGFTNGGMGGSRLVISDLVYRGNVGQQSRGLYVQEMTQLTANVTNTSFRTGGIYGGLLIGGGSAANTLTVASPIGNPAVIGAPTVGGGTSGNLTFIGNTTVSHISALAGGVTINAGSTTGNAFGLALAPTVNGTATTTIGVGASGGAGSSTPTNVFGFYWANTAQTYGIATANAARNATNYYAIYNEDVYAQTALGSLRSYNEFKYALTSSAGAITVNKNNGQVQQIDLTENITSVTFSNFVASAATNTTTKEQADTVTIVFNQGATGGYTVTLPTGSTYKYAGNIQTVGTTANAVTLVSVSALRLSGTTTYLITVSPEFV